MDVRASPRADTRAEGNRRVEMVGAGQGADRPRGWGTLIRLILFPTSQSRAHSAVRGPVMET